MTMNTATDKTTTTMTPTMAMDTMATTTTTTTTTIKTPKHQTSARKLFRSGKCKSSDFFVQRLKTG
eukprot:15005756-Ditylum_brightwellii.AAC.1